jgi:hypothetical protein
MKPNLKGLAQFLTLYASLAHKIVTFSDNTNGSDWEDNSIHIDDMQIELHG